MIKRRSTRSVWIGDVKIGGRAPVSVQSMAKTKTENVKSTVKQIKELEKLGCQIIRLAIPRHSSAKAIKHIKKKISIPVEADIHFSPALALEVINQGVDGIRLNPGNILDNNSIREIVKKAKKKRIPIRVGVNSGSVWGWQRKKKRAKKQPVWKTMVDCAIDFCRYLESLKFRDIMVSLKASDVISTVNAYRLMAKRTDYPLHLGVTAAGPAKNATVKSSLGIGLLLAEGIGDTIRVSVTGKPHEEILIGYSILEALGLRKPNPEIISCPTCGRCEIDIIGITEKVNKAVRDESFKIKKPGLKVAIMGCVVNGPGEASEADIGIAGGKSFAFLFRHGKKIRKIANNRIVPDLIKEIKKLK